MGRGFCQQCFTEMGCVVMKKINIVIGANYGDEGKGLFTNYITPKEGVVVLTNGGPQRGHTVVYEGKRHVFHHFGSATLKGAATYASSEFIVNPIKFREEFVELGNKPLLSVGYECRITTPFDCLANIVREKLRGKGTRKGISNRSTGCGIKETIDRYNDKNFHFKRVSDLYGNKDIWVEELLKIKEYYKELEWIKNSDYEESKLIKEDNFIINNFLKDLDFFFNNIAIKSMKEIYNEYDSITFEQGQGLGLDKEYDKVNGTPTRTGSIIPEWLLYMSDAQKTEHEIHRYYITRSYLSRHGDGVLENEDIDLDYEDQTNKPNLYQGCIRFAKFDDESIQNMMERIDSDIIDSNLYAKNYLVVTHCNEEELPSEKIKNKNFNQIFRFYDEVNCINN